MKKEIVVSLTFAMIVVSLTFAMTTIQVASATTFTYEWDYSYADGSTNLPTEILGCDLDGNFSNGDEIVATSRYQIHVLWNNGTLIWSDNSIEETYTRHGNAMCIADQDGDDFMDIVLGSRNTATNRVLTSYSGANGTLIDTFDESIGTGFAGMCYMDIYPSVSGMELVVTEYRNVADPDEYTNISVFYSNLTMITNLAYDDQAGYGVVCNDFDNDGVYEAVEHGEDGQLRIFNFTENPLAITQEYILRLGAGVGSGYGDALMSSGNIDNDPYNEIVYAGYLGTEKDWWVINTTGPDTYSGTDYSDAGVPDRDWQFTRLFNWYNNDQLQVIAGESTSGNQKYTVRFWNGTTIASFWNGDMTNEAIIVDFDGDGINDFGLWNNTNLEIFNNNGTRQISINHSLGRGNTDGSLTGPRSINADGTYIAFVDFNISGNSRVNTLTYYTTTTPLANGTTWKQMGLHSGRTGNYINTAPNITQVNETHYTIYDPEDIVYLYENNSADDYIKIAEIENNRTYMGTWSTMTKLLVTDGIETNTLTLTPSASPPSTPPTVSLNEPEDNNNSDSYSVTFNCSISDDINISTVSLYTDYPTWHANETNTSGINNADYIFTQTFTETSYDWNCYACDDLSNCAFAPTNRTFHINVTESNETILFDSTTLSKIINITLPRRYNLTGLTWNTTGYKFKYLYYQETEDNYAFGNPAYWFAPDDIHDGNWNTYGWVDFTAGCDPFYANYTKNESFYEATWEIKTAYNHTNITIPSDCFNYDSDTLQLRADSCKTPSASRTEWYCYNGTWKHLFQSYNTGSNEEVFRYIYEEAIWWNVYSSFPTNVTIDAGNDGVPDYINTTEFRPSEIITFNSTGIEAINYYLRNVCTSSFFGGYCDVPFNISSIASGILKISDIDIEGELISGNLTISVFDEETQSGINFNITITNSTTSYNSTDNANPHLIALEDLPNGLVTIAVSSDGYITRTYYLTLSQESNFEINAYLLSSSTGIYHSTFVIGNENIPLEDALVTVQVWMGGYYRTVEQHYTDTTGLALNFLNPITQYHFIVSADNYVSVTYDIYPNPVSPIVYVRLAYTGIEGAEFINYSILWDSISYQFLPDNYYFNDTFNATFEISSSANDLEYIGLNITFQNTTQICQEFVDSQPAGTTLLCTIPLVVGQYRVNGFFKRANYTQYDFNEFYYWVYNSTSGGLLDIDFSNTVSDLGYWIASIFLTMVVCGFASRFIGFGAGYLAIGMMAMAVALNPTIMIAGTMGWMIIALMVLALISLTVIRTYI